MRILLPYHYLPEYELDGSALFFLAGPISGGDNWQTMMALLFADIRGEDTLAIIPCRWEESHTLYKYRVGITDRTNRQTIWERFHMRMAAKHGCLVFWVPCESKTNPRPKETGSYAQDTLGELGRWSVHLSHDPSLKVVVGMEPGFPARSVAECNWNEDVGYNFPFYDTLEATVRAAVRKIS